MSTFATDAENEYDYYQTLISEKRELISSIFDNNSDSLDLTLNSTPNVSQNNIAYSDAENSISITFSGKRIKSINVTIKGNDNHDYDNSTIVEIIQKSEDKIKDIKELLDLNIYDHFQLDSYNELSDDYVILSVACQEENGVYNIGKSFNICYSRKNSAIISINAFYYEANSTEIKLSSDEARMIANEYIAEENKIENCNLQYIDPTLYQSDKTIETKQYKLAYLISCENGIILIIDAVNGNLIGVDMYLAEQARSYTIKETNVPGTWGFRSASLADYEITLYNYYRTENIREASAAFRRLGYNVTLSRQYDSSAINNSVNSYLQGSSNEYAFYFNGHGDSTVTYMGTVHETVFSRSNVRGNWHFVYLDGCYTASSTAWADAFHVRGYTNRAFLGWRGAVTLVNTYNFNMEFFPMLTGTKKVEEAARDAAALIPGAGTTPIRFYGDNSYKGRAWN